MIQIYLVLKNGLYCLMVVTKMEKVHPLGTTSVLSKLDDNLLLRYNLSSSKQFDCAALGKVSHQKRNGVSYIFYD